MIRLAFYKAAGGKFYQRVIAFWTGRGPYCHVEVTWPAWSGKWPDSVPLMRHDPGGSLCFSASEQDGGTRFKLIDLNPRQWDLVDIPIKPGPAFKWALAHLNIKYDFWGLRGFVFGRDDANPQDLWCSEAAIDICEDQNYLAGFPTNISPNALAELVGLIKGKGLEV